MRSHQLEERNLVRQHPTRNLPAFQIADQIILRGFLGNRESHAVSDPTYAIEQRQAAAISRYVLPVCARQSPIEVGDDTDLARARTMFVGRKHPLKDGPHALHLASAQSQRWLRLVQLTPPCSARYARVPA